MQSAFSAGCFKPYLAKALSCATLIAPCSANEIGQLDQSPGSGMQIEFPSDDPRIIKEPAAAACPASIRSEVTSPLPPRWWATPQIVPLHRLEVRRVGGGDYLACIYKMRSISSNEYIVLGKFPTGASACRVDSTGRMFKCW